MWRMRRFTYKSCRGGAPVPARSTTDCQHKKTPRRIRCGVFAFHLRSSASIPAYTRRDMPADYFSRSLRGIDRASRSILPGLNPTLRRAGT